MKHKPLTQRKIMWIRVSVKISDRAPPFYQPLSSWKILKTHQISNIMPVKDFILVKLQASSLKNFNKKGTPSQVFFKDFI